MRSNLNYTGREDIFEEDVHCHGRRDKDGIFISVTLDLEHFEFPPNATIALEVWAGSLGSNRVEIPMGTVGEIKNLDEHYVPELVVSTGKKIKATIRISDDDGKILGQIHKFDIELAGDIGVERQGILGVTVSKEPMNTIWRLSWDNDEPVLYINAKLDDPEGVGRTPTFQAIVFPQVLDMIAKKQVELASEDGANPDWKDFLDDLLAPLDFSLDELAVIFDEGDHEQVDSIVEQACDHIAGMHRVVELYNRDNGDAENE